MIFERLASRLTLFLLGLILLSGTGCDLPERLGIDGAPVEVASPTATPTAELPQLPPDELATPTPEATPVPQRTLTVWLPPEIGGRTQSATAVLTEQIRTFNGGYPDLQIVVQQKNVGGPGGMLSYLRTGRSVAPSVMPDLIVLPGDRLQAAFAEELIYPLGTGANSEMMDALYPAARSVARPQDVTLGYPLALTNLPHLAYDTDVITATFPISITQMLDLPDTILLYPGSGPDGVMIWLQLYLAHGGQLVDADGQPTLQAEPLRLTLEILEQARQESFITSQSSNVSSLAEAWQLFMTGNATIVQTSAAQFLQEGAPGQNYGVAPIPGLTGPLTPLVGSWAWAISTSDPGRRGLAIELVAFLAQPENLGEWSQAAHILPARADALLQWNADDLYVQFLDQELARAQPNPVVASSQLMNALRDAVFDVTSLAETPRAAAATAAAIFD
jgi:ABC-type glycerol-3-phosphate transport system substrate-binding protein